MLQKYARMAKSYIRDTPDFLRKLNNISLLGDVILVSFDVVNLYTSINHERGIARIRNVLINQDLSNECVTFCLTLLKIVLNENYFLFENTFSKQPRGTAMGSNLLPTYAYIFMAALKENNIYPCDFFHVATWWHFIDDIFVIWRDTQQSLDYFYVFLNQLDEDIKFTMTHSIGYIGKMTVSSLIYT